ncbi:hypothetical protein JT358_15095 [Micrococcales bacterium 31B]|nr:hypothetical protein [Micrococcales bacterium 31B]
MHAFIATAVSNINPSHEELVASGHEMLPLNPWAYGGMMAVFLLVCLFTTFAFRNVGSTH